MEEVLLSGKTSFKIEVPYRLVETGPKGPKPLILYLHGYKQNIDILEKKVSALKKLHAYHLFIQGPYPIYDEQHKRSVSQWGRAWYLYDGSQGSFVKSLEMSSEFIQEVVDKLAGPLQISRMAVVGYSMGGYLAGYFGLTRWKHVNELVVIGGRIKHEVLNDEQLARAGHLHILALHGKKDQSVQPESQQESVERLRKAGLEAQFGELDAGHRLNQEYIQSVLEWLKQSGYASE